MPQIRSHNPKTKTILQPRQLQLKSVPILEEINLQEQNDAVCIFLKALNESTVAGSFEIGKLDDGSLKSSLDDIITLGKFEKLIKEKPDWW